jgi:prepilin-type N-terminal cleavage/methylation domain-containing protein
MAEPVKTICRSELSPFYGASLSSSKRGFTLLELVIVILILGIVGLVGLPQFHSMSTESKLNEAAGELASGLEYAMGLAVAYQRPFGLMVNVDGNWFKVFDYLYKTDPNPHHDSEPPVDAYGVVINSLDKKWYTRDFDTMANYQGVRITSGPAGGETPFYPDGHCAYSDQTFVLSFAGEERTVTVNGTTGWVSIQ